MNNIPSGYEKLVGNGALEAVGGQEVDLDAERLWTDDPDGAGDSMLDQSADTHEQDFTDAPGIPDPGRAAVAAALGDEFKTPLSDAGIRVLSRMSGETLLLLAKKSNGDETSSPQKTLEPVTPINLEKLNASHFKVLHPRELEVISLMYGHTYHEIASHFGYSEIRTVANIVSNARRKLAKQGHPYDSKEELLVGIASAGVISLENVPKGRTNNLNDEELTKILTEYWYLKQKQIGKELKPPRNHKRVSQLCADIVVCLDAKSWLDALIMGVKDGLVKPKAKDLA